MIRTIALLRKIPPCQAYLQEQAREDSSSEDDNNNDSYDPIDPRPSIDVLIILIPIDTPPSNNYDNKVDLVLHTDLTHLHQSTPDYNRDNELERPTRNCHIDREKIPQDDTEQSPNRLNWLNHHHLV